MNSFDPQTHNVSSACDAACNLCSTCWDAGRCVVTFCVKCIVINKETETVYTRFNGNLNLEHLQPMVPTVNGAGERDDIQASCHARFGGRCATASQICSAPCSKASMYQAMDAS